MGRWGSTLWGQQDSYFMMRLCPWYSGGLKKQLEQEVRGDLRSQRMSRVAVSCF